MAELVDALVSKTSGLLPVSVRIRLQALWTLTQRVFLCMLTYRQMDSSHSSHLHPYKNKQAIFDQRYIEMARIWAKNSYCKRRQVGALMVKEKMIISDGYNGTPSGFENVCEDEHGYTKPYVLHAEANAITKVAKSNNSSENATLYVTTSPCLECAKLIIQSGIKRVVYTDRKESNDGIPLLERANIEVVQIDV